MTDRREALHEHDEVRESRAPGGRTESVELVRGDGHRWAALDVHDLDPPTPDFPGAG
jgi:hypothetical protein